MTVRALAVLFVLVVGPVCGQDESFASSLLSGLLDTLDTQVDAKNCPGVCMHALASLICTKVLDEVECPKSSMKCCVDEPLGNDTMITTRRPFTTRYTTTEADDDEEEEGPTTLAPHDAYKDSGNIACPGVCVETSLTQYCISYLTSKNLCAEGRLCCVSKEGYGDKPPADLVVPNEKKHSTKKPTTALTTVPPRPRPGRKCQGDCISGLFALLCDQVDEDAACPADGTCCVTDYRPETTTRRPTTPRPTTLPPLRRCPGRCMLTIMVAFCEQPATLMPNTECKASGRICCDDTNVPKRTKRPPTTSTTSTTPAPADARPDCPGSCIVPYLSFTCFRNAEMTDVFKCKKSGTQCCAPKSRVQEALGARDRNDTYPLTTSAPYVHAPPPTTAPMAIYEPSYGSTLKMPEKYNKYVCGVKGTSAAAGAGEVSGRRGRVMGGEDGERGEWCWQVALINSLNQYLCGAALIGTQWVLTAAHCVTNIVRSGEPIFVRVGDHDLTRKYGSPGAQTLRVATTYIHHNHNSQTLDNDIALLKLLGKAELKEETESQSNDVPALAVEITPPEGARTTNETMIDLTLKDASFSTFTPQCTPGSAKLSSITPGKRPLSTPRKAPLSTSEETPQKRTKLRCTPIWGIKVHCDPMPCVQDGVVVNLHDKIYSDSDDERTESDEEMRYERERCCEKDLIVSEKEREATGQNTGRQGTVGVMRRAANPNRDLIMSEKEREELSQMTERVRCKKNLNVCKKKQEATGQSAERQERVEEVRRDVSTKELEETSQNASGRDIVEKVIRKAAAICRCSLVLNEKDQETMSKSAERQERVKKVKKKAARCKRDLILSKNDLEAVSEKAERHKRVEKNMKKASRCKRKFILSEKDQEAMSESAERQERVEEVMTKATRCKRDFDLSEKDQETMSGSAERQEREEEEMKKTACCKRVLILTEKDKEAVSESAERQERVNEMIGKAVRCKGALILNKEDHVAVSESAERQEKVEEEMIKATRCKWDFNLTEKDQEIMSESAERQERQEEEMKKAACCKRDLILTEKDKEAVSESAERQKRANEMIGKAVRCKGDLILSEEDHVAARESAERQERVEEQMKKAVCCKRDLILSKKDQEAKSGSAERQETVEEDMKKAARCKRDLILSEKDQKTTSESAGLSPERKREIEVIREASRPKRDLIVSAKKREETTESAERQERVKEVIKKTACLKRPLISSKKERKETSESGGGQASVEEVIDVIEPPPGVGVLVEPPSPSVDLSPEIQDEANLKDFLFSSEKEREETSESAGRQESVEEVIGKGALISSKNERKEHRENVGRQKRVEEAIRKKARPKRALISSEKEESGGRQESVEEVIRKAARPERSLISSEKEQEAVSESAERQERVEKVTIKAARCKGGLILSEKDEEAMIESVERQEGVEEVIKKAEHCKRYLSVGKTSERPGRQESVEEVIYLVIEDGEPPPGIGVLDEEMPTFDLSPEIQDEASLNNFLISSEKEREETSESAGRQESVEEVIGKRALISSINERKEHSESVGRQERVEEVIRKTVRPKRALISIEKERDETSISGGRQESVEELIRKTAHPERALISSEKKREAVSESAERKKRVKKLIKKAARCKGDFILSETDEEVMIESAEQQEGVEEVMKNAAHWKRNLIVKKKDHEPLSESSERQKRVETVMKKAVRCKKDLILSQKDHDAMSERAERQKRVEEVIRKTKRPKRALILSEKDQEIMSESAKRLERVEEVMRKAARCIRDLIVSEKKLKTMSESGRRQERVGEVMKEAACRERDLILSEKERETVSESARRRERLEEAIKEAARCKRALILKRKLILNVKDREAMSASAGREEREIEVMRKVTRRKKDLIVSAKKREETGESAGRQKRVEKVIGKVACSIGDLIVSDNKLEETSKRPGRYESVEEVIRKIARPERSLISSEKEREKHNECAGRQERVEEVIRKTKRPKGALISSEKEQEEYSESAGRLESVKRVIRKTVRPKRALISSENEREKTSEIAERKECVEDADLVIGDGESPPGVGVLVEEILTIELSPEIQERASLKDFLISSKKEQEETTESAGRQESVEEVIDLVIEDGEPPPGVGVLVEEILTIELSPEIQEQASLKEFFISSEKEREETTESARRQERVEEVIDLVIEDGEPSPGVGVLVEEIVTVALSPEIQEQASLKDFSWSEDFSTFSGNEETYLRTPGPSIPAHDPVEIFKYIWDERIMQVIVDETNRYAWQFIAPISEVEGGIPETSNDWYDTNIDEMYRYFAVVILMSLCHRSRVNDYWETGPFSMPDFRKLMSRSRFQAIFRFLHFVDNEYFEPLHSSNHKKISKVRPIIEHCNAKFQQMYVPNKHLNLDESLWKGRLSRQRCPSIEGEFERGFKSYELCESQTGYLVKYLLPAGKDSSTLEESVHGFENASAKVVLELMDGFLDAGHTLTMDNWYDQLSLTRFLKRRGTDVLGTMCPRRHLHVPQDIRAANLSRGEQLACHCGDVTLVAWMDDKLVTAMSTYHDNSVVSLTRAGVPHDQPAVIAAYNKYMGGGKLKDVQLSMYPMERKKGVKWYMKVFLRMLNTSILNAYIVHCSTAISQPLTHRNFRIKVAVDLLDRHDRTPRELPMRLPVTTPPIDKRLQPGNHFMGLTEMKVSGSCLRYHVQKHCARCLAQGRRTLVKYMCTLCDVALCASQCWAEYHTLTKLN